MRDGALLTMPENNFTGLNGLRKLQTWHKNVLAMLIIATLGIAVWSQRINRSQGFLTDDRTHLEYSYRANLNISPYKYLPGVVAHRPIGRDAITVLLRSFGENAIPMIWTFLLIHILTTALIWHLLYRVTDNWRAALGGHGM